MAITTDFTVRVGTSDNVDMQLLTDADGDGVADSGINLSGIDHAELVLINKDTGATTSYSSAGTKFLILAGTAGSVRFIPAGTADLSLTAAGKTNIYSGYVWVYVSPSKRYSVPESYELTIRVRE